MLVIRLQRTGRKGHASFRLIVQDSRRSPMSGNIVAYIGSYNPHNKTVTIDKEKTEAFLKNGAKPSPRVISILKSEGIKLPKWVAKPDKKKGSVRHPEKRRSTAPAGTTVEKPVKEEPTEDKEEKETVADAGQEPTVPEKEETKAEEPASDTANEQPSETAPTDEQEQSTEPEKAEESKE